MCEVAPISNFSSFSTIPRIKDSYLGKILSGRLSTPKIVQAIREILDLPDQPQEATLPAASSE